MYTARNHSHYATSHHVGEEQAACVAAGGGIFENQFEAQLVYTDSTFMGFSHIYTSIYYALYYPVPFISIVPRSRKSRAIPLPTLWATPGL